jgi:hypothetical protein
MVPPGITPDEEDETWGNWQSNGPLKVGACIRLKNLVQHPSFNGVEGTITEQADDGRWHMSMVGKALGFHLRFAKAQNLEVL